MNHRSFHRFGARIALAAACCAALPSCTPEPPVIGSNARARAVIEAVTDSLGGPGVLDSILTLAAQYSFVQYGVGTGAAGSTTQQLDVMQARDFVNGRSYFEFQGTDQSGEVWERIVVTPAAAFRYDLIADSTAPLLGSAADLAAYSTAQLSWYVYQAIINARFNVAGLQFVADTVLDGAAQQIVRFRQNNGIEITLYVDAATARITKRTTMQAEPQATALPITYVYADYQEVDGLPVPLSVTMYEGDRLAARYDILQLLFNVELNEAAFAEPG